MSDTLRHSKSIPVELAGKRLDQSLAAMFPEFSRARLKAWIEAGNVSVDGQQRRPRDEVFGGETVVLDTPPQRELGLSPEAMPLDVRYRDDDCLVINKPAGLVVHPGAGNADGTLVNGLLHLEPALAGLPRAGLVHRLDKETSGLLVVARHQAAFDALTAALAARDVKREYLALCVGHLSGGGEFDDPIGRHPVDRKRMAVRDRGRTARTLYAVERRYHGFTLCRVRLHTGRTHQIRVHFAHAGHPLAGDPVYGRPAFPRGAGDALRTTLEDFRRQALHASRLSFAQPVSGDLVEVEAPLPADFERLLAALDAHERELQ